MSATGRVVSYSLMGTLLALMLALILRGALALHLVIAWLVAINVFTPLFYGIDKLNSMLGERHPEEAAAQRNLRIPEAVLLLLALLGGSLTALLAVALLPHKSNKIGFVLWLLAILALQVAALVYFQDRIPWPGSLQMG
jgi:uncharacterized membrane protein YsdA (DUF1294 family)